MDKVKIKSFATWARINLIEAIKYRAYSIGIEKECIREIERVGDGFRVKGRGEVFDILPSNRDILIKEINNRGFNNIIEEVAYTWFNRLIALRYMEVNEYIPSGIRVLSSEIEEKAEPDIISRVEDVIDELNLERYYIYNLVDIGTKDAREVLYRYILLKQCNELGRIIPYLFEKKEDYTEILLPYNLLDEGSIIKKLCADIDEQEWKGSVEIIGWMYQYYIAEEKERVFEGLKNNIKITKENIPVATQLFTPKWIVKYLVENSLGRLWMQGHAYCELQKSMDFYINQEEQSWKSEEVIYTLKVKRSELNPEDITILDPCMGSGHILVYAFEILYKIYLSLGYRERDIPRKILENNIYGLDIDGRAVQLGSFALVMKAREYNRRLFRELEKNPLKLNVAAIEESNLISDDIIEFFAGDEENLKSEFKYLVSIFKDAKEYGSILKVSDINFYAIERRLEYINDNYNGIYNRYLNIINEVLPRLINQGKIMSKKYEVCITNPPYMGLRGTNDTLAKYISNEYPISKHDLFSVFMEVCNNYLVNDGIYAMVNQHSWMFLSSFLELRDKLLNETTFINMVHLGSKAFEENVGTIVQNVAFINQKTIIPGYRTKVVDVTNGINSLDKANLVKEVSVGNKNDIVYSIDLRELRSIPSRPFAYWISEKTLNIFSKMDRFEAMAKPRQGMATSDNKRFLREWYEVDINKINFSANSKDAALKSEKKWFPYNKGGEFRKWFGNNRYVINWEKDGLEVKEYAASLYKSYSRTIKNEEFYFKSGITYTFISENMGFRYSPNGFIFDVAGSSIFFYNEGLEKLMLAFLCSKVSNMFMDIMNPTFNIQVGDLKNLPLSPDIFKDDVIEKVNPLVEENIKISEEEWDSFETSWNFKKHPLIPNREFYDKGICKAIEFKIKDQFQKWSMEREEAIKKIKNNEEKLNSIFIEVYGLKEEISPNVKLEEITLRKANAERDIKSLISYGIGCIMGRYSLDINGIIYGGGRFEDKWDLNNKKINCDGKWKKSLINPKEDNILPITDGKYFDDDITSRFINFLQVAFGENNLKENIEFIANILGEKEGETSIDTLRRYFLKDFYKDHLKIYNKKPIYWMIDSGKQDGVKALIYVHRYYEEILSEFRMNYLNVIQRKYEVELKHFSIIEGSNNYTNKERTIAKRKVDKLKKQIAELINYEKALYFVADKKISINLDNGIRNNYELFQDIKLDKEKLKKVKVNILSKI